MTPEQLQKLRKLAEAATPGEWKSFEVGPWGGQGFGVATIPVDEDSFDFFVNSNNTDVASKNALYIAAANPTTMLALLDRIEQLERLAKNDALDALAKETESLGIEFK